MLYQLSYGPLFPLSLHAFGDTDHGQGQNRTADTMIFSHVLYQLSYLAQTKNPLEPLLARAGSRRRNRLLAALRSRPHSRAPRVGNRPENGAVHAVSFAVPNMGNAAVRAALHEQIAGAGFEPATFGL